MSFKGVMSESSQSGKTQSRQADAGSTAVVCVPASTTRLWQKLGIVYSTSSPPLKHKQKTHYSIIEVCSQTA